MQSAGAKIIRVEMNQSPQFLAMEEAANTGGFPLPGILFRQGSRSFISTAIPMRRIRQRLLEVRSAAKKGTVADVQAATNRPVMPEHVSNIAGYLRENVSKNYILPPMTLNVQSPPISVYTPTSVADGGYGSVFIVIPETATLSVTDGGHRTTAIIEAWERMSQEQREEFDRHAVSVMITLEGQLSQVHQDFADCSKTKALPPSQLAAYDRRNPANGIVLDLIERCRLFSDKIDSTSKTLSKTSTNLFLTNQVRQLVKELLVGDYAMADDQFEIKAKQLLGSNSTEHYAVERDKFVEFVDIVTDAVPVLSTIASLARGTARNKIVELRSEGWICLTATGMVIIGRIGHELFREERSDWREMTARLKAVDWSRNGEFWQNNIVNDGKMSTTRAPVRIAVENVRQAIGLPPKYKADDEQREQPSLNLTAA
jgi:DGQHR domain-containing protein